MLTGLRIVTNGSTFVFKCALASVYCLLFFNYSLCKVTSVYTFPNGFPQHNVSKPFKYDNWKSWCVTLLLQAGDGLVMKHSILHSWAKASNEIIAICLDVEMLLKHSSLSIIECVWKVCFLQMKIHSPSPHKQVPSKCNDYFFNYFTLGVVSGKLP